MQVLLVLIGAAVVASVIGYGVYALTKSLGHTSKRRK